MSGLIFLTFLGFFLTEITGLSFALFNPITFVALAILIGIAIVAGNTPILKGAAVAGVGVVIFASFFVSGFFDSLGATLFGLLLIPLTILTGFIFMEFGKG